MTRALLESIGFTLAEMAWIVAVCLLFHNRGYKRGKAQGYQDGFEAGRIRSEEWWTDAELDVQKAREEIWKEEG